VTIGEIAGQCGLRASAIRYYEETGLLPKPPRVSGRRVYGADTVSRIAFIQFAREAGFTLAEIKVLTGAGDSARQSAARQSPARQSPARPFSARMRKLAEKKIEEVDRLVERARLMKAMLTRALNCQCLDTVECGGRILARRKAG
jgi:MerR family redox-sensitive transcriptional activator SoxR